MIIYYKDYKIEKVKDGTMDTVLKINDFEVRFDYKYAASFRDGEGFLSAKRAEKMYDEAIWEYEFLTDPACQFIGNGRG